jgi:hypothetical protein
VRPGLLAAAGGPVTVTVKAPYTGEVRVMVTSKRAEIFDHEHITPLAGTAVAWN